MVSTLNWPQSQIWNGFVPSSFTFQIDRPSDLQIEQHNAALYSVFSWEPALWLAHIQPDGVAAASGVKKSRVAHSLLPPRTAGPPKLAEWLPIMVSFTWGIPKLPDRDQTVSKRGHRQYYDNYGTNCWSHFQIEHFLFWDINHEILSLLFLTTTKKNRHEKGLFGSWLIK